jgi:hypothetical protein
MLTPHRWLGLQFQRMFEVGQLGGRVVMAKETALGCQITMHNVLFMYVLDSSQNIH